VFEVSLWNPGGIAYFARFCLNFGRNFTKKKNETFKDFFRDFLIFFRFSRFFGFEKRNAMEISIFAFP